MEPETEKRPKSQKKKIRVRGKAQRSQIEPETEKRPQMSQIEPEAEKRPTSQRKMRVRGQINSDTAPTNQTWTRAPPPLYRYHQPVAFATYSPRACDLSSDYRARLYNYCVIRSLKLALVAEKLEIERRASFLPISTLYLLRKESPMPYSFCFTYVLGPPPPTPNFGHNHFYPPQYQQEVPLCDFCREASVHRYVFD